jgi:hypothetical protein
MLSSRRNKAVNYFIVRASLRLFSFDRNGINAKQTIIAMKLSSIKYMNKTSDIQFLSKQIQECEEEFSGSNIQSIIASLCQIQSNNESIKIGKLWQSIIPKVYKSSTISAEIIASSLNTIGNMNSINRDIAMLSQSLLSHISSKTHLVSLSQIERSFGIMSHISSFGYDKENMIYIFSSEIAKNRELWDGDRIAVNIIGRLRNVDSSSEQAQNLLRIIHKKLTSECNGRMRCMSIATALNGMHSMRSDFLVVRSLVDFFVERMRLSDEIPLPKFYHLCYSGIENMDTSTVVVQQLLSELNIKLSISVQTHEFTLADIHNLIVALHNLSPSTSRSVTETKLIITNQFEKLLQNAVDNNLFEHPDNFLKCLRIIKLSMDNMGFDQCNLLLHDILTPFQSNSTSFWASNTSALTQIIEICESIAIDDQVSNVAKIFRNRAIDEFRKVVENLRTFDNENSSLERHKLIWNALSSCRYLKFENPDLLATLPLITHAIKSSSYMSSCSDISQALFSYHNMNSNFREVRDLMAAINVRIKSLPEKSNWISDMSSVLKSLHEKKSDHAEVREYVELIANTLESMNLLTSFNTFEENMHCISFLNSTASEVKKFIDVLSDCIQRSHVSPGISHVDLSPSRSYLFGFQNLNSDHKSTLKLLESFNSKFDESPSSIPHTKRLIVGFNGLRNCSVDHVSVRDTVRIVATSMDNYALRISLQQLASVLFGMRRMDSNYPEVAYMIDVLVDKIWNHSSGKINSLAITNALNGLQGKHSKHANVRQLISHLVPHFDKCMDAMGTHELLYGMRGLEYLVTDSSEVQMLYCYVSKALRKSGGKYDGNALKAAFLGLRNNTKMTGEIKSILKSLCDLVLALNTMSNEQISKCLSSLRNFSTETKEVKYAIRALKQKLDNNSNPLTPEELSLCLWGIQGSPMSDKTTRSLLTSLSNSMILSQKNIPIFRSADVEKCLRGLSKMYSCPEFVDSSACVIMDRVVRSMACNNAEFLSLENIVQVLQGMKYFNSSSSANEYSKQILNILLKNLKQLPNDELDRASTGLLCSAVEGLKGCSLVEGNAADNVLSIVMRPLKTRKNIAKENILILFSIFYKNKQTTSASTELLHFLSQHILTSPELFNLSDIAQCIYNLRYLNETSIHNSQVLAALVYALKYYIKDNPQYAYHATPVDISRILNGLQNLTTNSLLQNEILTILQIVDAICKNRNTETFTMTSQEFLLALRGLHQMNNAHVEVRQTIRNLTQILLRSNIQFTRTEMDSMLTSLGGMNLNYIEIAELSNILKANIHIVEKNEFDFSVD